MDPPKKNTHLGVVPFLTSDGPLLFGQFRLEPDRRNEPGTGFRSRCPPGRSVDLIRRAWDEMFP